jgi:5'-deoxynucleotidase YfbR-like HD superfamily hydrolase
MSHAKILTRSGDFDLLDPFCPDNRIDIEEIAQALANLCRYNGHTQYFYSVAQHSLHVCDILMGQPELRQHAFAGLMHDAAEALIGDIVKPLKRLLPDYQRIERDVEAAVFDRFGLPAQLDPCVKRADMVMLRTELRDFMGVTDEQAHRAWALPADVEPLQERLFPMPPRQARDTFLARFHELFDQMKSDRDVQCDVQCDLPQDRPRLSMG